MALNNVDPPFKIASNGPNQEPAPVPGMRYPVLKSFVREVPWEGTLFKNVCARGSLRMDPFQKLCARGSLRRDLFQKLCVRGSLEIAF
jgi:hypothetical protein